VEIAYKEKNYSTLVKFAAYSASGTALLLVLIKFYAWFITDSGAMLASTADSLLDLCASIINVVILRFALSPADEKHKFGYGKAESLAGLGQSVFVIASALFLIYHGVGRMITPQEISHSEIGISVTVLAILLTLGLVIVQKVVIKKTDSVAISADSLHYQSDLILNIGVLLALFLSESLWARADGLFTILVGIFLLRGAAQIICMSLYHLMDQELENDEQSIIIDIVSHHENACGIHDLRTRQSGSNKFIQFHLELDASLPLFEAHAIGKQIEKQIEEAISSCEVLIHHKPSAQQAVHDLAKKN